MISVRWNGLQEYRKEAATTTLIVAESRKGIE